MATKRLVFSVTIADCDVDDIASTSGAGGQHRNRSHTAIRVRHKASGAVGFSADERSQLSNKQAAFGRMARTPTFQKWLKIETAKRLGLPSVEDQVEAMMAPQNLKIEIQDGKGRWTPEIEKAPTR